jgi:hypothetical protein
MHGIIGIAVEGRAEPSKAAGVSVGEVWTRGCRLQIAQGLWMVGIFVGRDETRRGVQNGDEGKLESFKIACEGSRQSFELSCFASLERDCTELGGSRESGFFTLFAGLRLSLDRIRCLATVTNDILQAGANSTHDVLYAHEGQQTPRRCNNWICLLQPSLRQLVRRLPEGARTLDLDRES